LFHNKMEPALFVPRHAWVKGEGDTKGGMIRMFVGDKVIVTRNMYELNVFNGESGKIIEISHEGELVIDFGDREQCIPPIMMVQNRYGKIVEIDPRKDIDLGYAITTHKAQGSEYDNVVYVLNKSTGYMQNRRNFYTAASRGRAHVHIITDQRSISLSLSKMG
jgi:exodeoxyribonuclease V alpha subunit